MEPLPTSCFNFNLPASCHRRSRLTVSDAKARWQGGHQDVGRKAQELAPLGITFLPKVPSVACWAFYMHVYHVEPVHHVPAHDPARSGKLSKFNWTASSGTLFCPARLPASFGAAWGPWPGLHRTARARPAYIAGTPGQCTLAHTT
jgi:hypothetical protein